MKKNNIAVAFGQGTSDLFLSIEDNEPRLLSYEYNADELHDKCGGRQYYWSRSGCSGAGFFVNLGDLLTIGLYRVDITYNSEQLFAPIGKDPDGEEVLVAVPYASHTEDLDRYLRTYPTVIKVGSAIFYCDFYRNLLDVLQAVLAGKNIIFEILEGRMYGKYILRQKELTNVLDWDVREENLQIQFFNMSCIREKELPDPWEFFSEELSPYMVTTQPEHIFQLLGVEKLEDGTFVRTRWINGAKYRGKILPGDPLVTGNLTAGWKKVVDDVLVRYYDQDNEVHLVAYNSFKASREKVARRFATHLGENEEFVSSVCSHDEATYEEFELVVPKALYLLDSGNYIDQVRKGLAKKVRADVKNRVRQWARRMEDKAILEEIPDDRLVTVDDSLEAGNCLPGTEAFVQKFFPGRSSVKAEELKKYADNYSVMRIFRYLAGRGQAAS